MNRERRNLYRLLHVQPEAPTEVITAAYRCMMSKLKMHPDLGGNHEIAARLNEAYATLSDPDKRHQYDTERKVRASIRAANRSEPSSFSQSNTRSGGGFTAHTADPEPKRSTRRFSGQHCPMCNHALPRFVASDTRCAHCDSPVAPLAHNLNVQREALGRRMSNRVTRSDAASLQLAAQLPFVPARLRDMSLTGIGLVTADHVVPDSVIRVMTDTMDLVAHVVKVRRANNLLHVHARLLTGHFGKRSGSYFSATA